MKAKLLAIALGIGLCSCGQRIPSEYKAFFKESCKVNKKEITSLININGFHDAITIIKSRHNDTGGHRICVEGWGAYEKDAQKYLNEVVASKGKNYFYINAEWGCYQIRHDTIIMRRIMPGTVMRPVSVWESRYKVIDRNTIQQIFHASIARKPKSAPLKDETDSDLIYLPSVFTPLNNIPDSKYSWLSKERCK